jgi:hypothetical protein
MVGTRANNADLDSVALIPSCEAVDNVDSVSCVQVVNGTFAVDLPNLPIENTSALIAQSKLIRL